MSFLDILIIFFIFLIPIISKSVQEKRKIEEERFKGFSKATLPRSKSRTKNVKRQETKSALETRSMYNEDYNTSAKRTISRLQRETFKPIVEEVSTQAKTEQDVSAYKMPQKGKQKSKKLTKRDLIKGIVLKEILSEPKCMENRIR